MKKHYRLFALLPVALVTGYGIYLSTDNTSDSDVLHTVMRPPSAEAAAPTSPANKEIDSSLAYRLKRPTAVSAPTPIDQALGKTLAGIVSSTENETSKLDAALLQLLMPRRDSSFEHGYVLNANGSAVMVEMLTIDANAKKRTISALTALGLHQVEDGERVITGWLPINALRAVSKNPDIISVQAMQKIEASVGRVQNQGDVAQLSDLVRQRHGLDGRGVKIGIISPSFNLLGGLSSGVAGGELPGAGNPNGFTQPIRILTEGDRALIAPTSIDEGRAMAELIHDIAPRAEIMFAAPRGGSPVNMATAMQTLASAGANIIVDDISTNPALTSYFQDAAAARKIDALTAQGIRYFTASGNLGKSAFEAPWTTLTNDGLEFFDFDPGAGTEQFVLVGPDDGVSTYNISFTLQWDQPWPELSTAGRGNQSQLSLFVLKSDGSSLAQQTAPIGGNPVLSFTLRNISASENPFVAFALPFRGGTPPGRIKAAINVENGFIDDSVVLNASPIFGHNNASTAIVVGSASWFNTPVAAHLWNRTLAGGLLPDGRRLGQAIVPIRAVLSYAGGTSPLLGANNTSSVGQQPILFDNNGARLSQPELRRNPAFIAPDGVETSFFGSGPSLNINGTTRFFFFGTSAAAPNAAAVGALLLQAAGGNLSPRDMKNHLSWTAQDMDDPYANGLQSNPSDPLFALGYDSATGYGFLQATTALRRVINGVGFKQPWIEPLCSTSSARRWRVHNPNGYGYGATLKAFTPLRLFGESSFGGNSRGVLIPAGSSLTFETTVYANFVQLDWPAPTPELYAGTTYANRYYFVSC